MIKTKIVYFFLFSNIKGGRLSIIYLFIYNFHFTLHFLAIRNICMLCACCVQMFIIKTGSFTLKGYICVYIYICIMHYINLFYMGGSIIFKYYKTVQLKNKIANMQCNVIKLLSNSLAHYNTI